MATLVLGAIGTLVGGPVGGAIGALAGRQIDSQIMGSSGREGPRLKDLALTTSSYGNPIARHFGRMRTAGSIIWSTDLVENRESTGGGKGKPKTTTFSYTTSFAVALSSRPILNVGKIWADGNLLRGAAGDLKVGGEIRVHNGRGAQSADPLMVAAEGSRCPAFRHCAYVVFEDLDLSDFGNRIPALTFEVIADSGQISLSQLLPPDMEDTQCDVILPNLAGFSYEGGSFASVLETIDTLFPMDSDAGGDQLTINHAARRPVSPAILPEAAISWNDEDFGTQSGARRARQLSRDTAPDALRYYDVSRDFQPGIQRADGRARTGRTRTMEFPGAMSANDARALANAGAQRAHWMRETLAWRVAELDPGLKPGSVVTVPKTAGLWSVTEWEWREAGIELQLVKLPPIQTTAPAGDFGQPWSAPDESARETWFRAFELPWDGTGSADNPAIFAAASASGSNWSGAALYIDNGGSLSPIQSTGSLRSICGTLVGNLQSSEAVLLEPEVSLEINLAAADLQFRPATVANLAMGANRLLLGDEIIQFARAEQLDDRRWRLSGVLRGRGGTELAAQGGHPAGTLATLLDDSLTPLDSASIPVAETSVISAIGRGDDEPVVAQVENYGITLRPLSPVHGRARFTDEGGVTLGWTRRARGSWLWRDEVGVPLVEQSENYLIGVGPVLAPVALWESSQPEIFISPAEHQSLKASHHGSAVWVRQIGTYAQSDPLFITQIG